MMNHARVFKKTAPNGKITLYVERRELCIRESGIEPLTGILFVDANYVKDRKVFGQFVLTFRYGREDEEVMGLRFCNEACLQAQQLWPKPETESQQLELTPLQDTLVKRLGSGAVPFSFTVSSLAPPSVTLLPARSYNGAPIGTNYDLRIFVGDNPEDKPHKRSSIRMGMKLFQMANGTDRPQPYAAFSKQLLLADGQVEVEATLDKAVYERGEEVGVSVSIANHSSRNVRRIKIMVVQYVDVAMFSNGKFKNIVATMDSTEGCPVTSGATITRQYHLRPARGTIKNWIALEEFYDRDSSLASSVCRPDAQERNVFAIYVSYYVKVKLFTSAIGGEVSVKVPFKLMRRPTTDAPTTTTTTATNTTQLPESAPSDPSREPNEEDPSPSTPRGPTTASEGGTDPLQHETSHDPTPNNTEEEEEEEEEEVKRKKRNGGSASEEEGRRRKGVRGGGGRDRGPSSRCFRLCRLCLGLSHAVSSRLTHPYGVSSSLPPPPIPPPPLQSSSSSSHHQTTITTTTHAS